MMKQLTIFLFLLFGLSLLGCQPTTTVAVAATPAGGISAAPGGATAVVATAIPASTDSIPTATLAPATNAPVPTSAAVATARPPATSVAKGIDLHAVNWTQFLASDPQLNHPAAPLPVFPQWPYVAAKNSSPQNPVQGYAVSDGILFLSFSDDWQEEAVVSLQSGGTAGNLGLLIYRAGPTAPVLVATLGGYKIGAVADGNQLLVREPIYAGWEPNCCPGGFSETRYRLQGNQLVMTNHQSMGIPQAKSATVDEFYRLLSDKKYQEAYAFTTPAYQASQPFVAWRAGYQNTVSFTAHTQDQPDGTVAVDLTSVDQTANGQVARHYKGTWALVWSDAARQWLLDRGQFTVVP